MIYLKRLTSSLAFALAAIAVAPATASDHLDAPSLSGNGQVDINDLFAFQNPNNPNNSVLILTVNPGAGALSPTDFGTDVSYQIQVSNAGDAAPEITYEATFAGAGAAQTINLTRNGVPQAAGLTGTTLQAGTGGRVSTGVFDDPFFFDLNGFNDGFQFTGDDFFAGLDVSAIVLEVPNSELNGATGDIAVSARTVQGGNQIDRVGRPAINTALIVGDDQKELFNVSDPVNDFSGFGDDVEARIAALNGGDLETAEDLAGVLLPDVLTFNTGDASGFLNGRGLADNVIDAELNLLTNGAITTDGVLGNDVEFLNVFPFLAPANATAIPEPSGLLPIALAFSAILIRRRR